ncbi:MAG: hypothetical protein QG639_1142 [Patescibacteria group bacterium]|nr:hypothetical protein [Patescibacteria group bacterium]
MTAVIKITDKITEKAILRIKMKITSVHYKIAAESILAIPMILLIILGSGEMVGGDISGAQHFIELIPFIFLAIISWLYPKLGGIILTACSALLAALYITLFGSFPMIYRIINDVILFLPPFVAGILFLTAGMESEKDELGIL